jgi:NADH-quinone oxidoreductase subunit K
MSELQLCLLVSSLLFCLGLVGALARSNTILVLLGIELMLNAANLNFIAFWRYSANANELTGLMFVIFSIGIAAAEAAVGLAIVIALNRTKDTLDVDAFNLMKG